MVWFFLLRELWGFFFLIYAWLYEFLYSIVFGFGFYVIIYDYL